MAYFDIAALSRDWDFQQRCAACYATETLDEVNNEGYIAPDSWVAVNAWALAAQPGFADAYASALAHDPPNPSPGKDPSVITDGMILGAVQSLLTE